MQANFYNRIFKTKTPTMKNFSDYWEYFRNRINTLPDVYNVTFDELCDNAADAEEDPSTTLNDDYALKVFEFLFHRFISKSPSGGFVEEYRAEQIIEQLCANVESIKLTSEPSEVETTVVQETKQESVEVPQCNKKSKKYVPVEESERKITINSIEEPYTYPKEKNTMYIKIGDNVFVPVPNWMIPDCYSKGKPISYRMYEELEGKPFSVRNFGALKPFNTSHFKYQPGAKSYDLVYSKDKLRFVLFNPDYGVWKCGNVYIQLLKFESEKGRRFIKMNHFDNIIITPEFIEKYNEIVTGKYIIYFFPLDKIEDCIGDIQVQNLKNRIEQSKEGEPKTFIKTFKRFKYAIPECFIEKKENGAILVSSFKKTLEVYGKFTPFQGSFQHNGKTMNSKMGNFFINDEYLACVSLKY